mgnify:CR=1 FL=1
MRMCSATGCIVGASSDAYSEAICLLRLASGLDTRDAPPPDITERDIRPPVSTRDLEPMLLTLLPPTPRLRGASLVTSDDDGAPRESYSFLKTELDNPKLTSSCWCPLEGRSCPANNTTASHELHVCTPLSYSLRHQSSVISHQSSVTHSLISIHSSALTHSVSHHTHTLPLSPTHSPIHLLTHSLTHLMGSPSTAGAGSSSQTRHSCALALVACGSLSPAAPSSYARTPPLPNCSSHWSSSPHTAMIRRTE